MRFHGKCVIQGLAHTLINCETIEPYPHIHIGLVLNSSYGAMLTLLAIVLFVPSMHALLHHLAVGTTNGQALYSLETDDESRKVYTIQARDAGGASPSLALDVRELIFSKDHSR